MRNWNIILYMRLRKQVKEHQQQTMNEHKKLHIALFPWLAFGHIIPFLELAKLIAQRGHKISFISTPKNIQRLPKIPPNLSPNINLISLTLPSVENLPHDAESTIDIPFHKVQYLIKAYNGLQGPLLQFLQTSTPDWICYDFFSNWLPPIAAGLEISSALFSIFGGWTITFRAPSLSAMINGDDSRTKPEDFTVPPKWIPFPSKVAYRLHETKKMVKQSLFPAIIASCEVIAIRSCYELDPDFLRLVGELYGKPVLPVGLLPASALDASDGEDDTWLRIKEWLDKQNKGSVIYIAFGSEVEVSQSYINEIALGLELSGLPFFWALRKRDNSAELPDGFEERVKRRGLVWTSWVPQPRILGHDSVGGFLTHCGLNSIVDALHFGCALIMLPLAFDHGLTARFFEDKKVGVEITRDEEDGSFTRNSVAESLMLVMVDKEGKKYRDSAKEMSKLFADKDLQNRYIDQFIEFLQNHRVGCRD